MSHKEYAGSFLFGRRDGNLPEPLTKWRMVANDAEVRGRLEEVLGGRTEKFFNKGSRVMEILTESADVQILLGGVDSIRLEMVLWGHSGVIHHCDGVGYLSPKENRGKPCGCPPEIEKRKLNAKNGVGPQPSVEMEFRIAKCPELGVFSFRSNSWRFFSLVNDVKRELAEIDRETLCELSIQSFELESVENITLAYLSPVIEVLES